MLGLYVRTVWLLGRNIPSLQWERIYINAWGGVFLPGPLPASPAISYQHSQRHRRLPWQPPCQGVQRLEPWNLFCKQPNLKGSVLFVYMPSTQKSTMYNIWWHFQHADSSRHGYYYQFRKHMRLKCSLMRHNSAGTSSVSRFICILD